MLSEVIDQIKQKAYGAAGPFQIGDLVAHPLHKARGEGWATPAMGLCAMCVPQRVGKQRLGGRPKLK